MNIFYNEELSARNQEVSVHCEAVKQALYEQYKLARCLTMSLNFRGEAADAYKNYISMVSIYLINKLLNIADEVNNVMQAITNNLGAYEQDAAGIIGFNAIDHVAGLLSGKKTSFEQIISQLKTVNAKASQYSPVKAISSANVLDGYRQTSRDFDGIKTDIDAINTQLAALVDTVSEHIMSVNSEIANIQNDYYTPGGEIDYEAVGRLTTDPPAWYMPESGETLLRMWCDDPFLYSAEQGAVWEDAWAAGLTTDLYAMAGAAFLTGSYEIKLEDGVASLSGEGYALHGDAYAQVTDYLRGSAEAYLFGASGSAKIGWSDDYKGYKFEGSAAVAKATGSVKLGSDKFNGYIKGNASVLSADGYLVKEFEDAENWDFGVGGSASLAGASASAGFSFLEVKGSGKDENGEPEKVNLFGLSGGVSAAVGVDAGARVTSQTVIDSGVVKVNTVSVSLHAKALLGVNIDITFPTISFGW
jgi:hypothetical protein